MAHDPIGTPAHRRASHSPVASWPPLIDLRQQGAGPSLVGCSITIVHIVGRHVLPIVAHSDQWRRRKYRAHCSDDSKTRTALSDRLCVADSSIDLLSS